MEFLASQRKIELEPWPYSDPPTIKPFYFEQWNALKWREWMSRNWPLSVVASSHYLLLIFIGQRIMKRCKPFDLRYTMAFWNLLLASFSACGFLRTFPELYQVLSGKDGFHRSVCVRDILNESSIFWAWLFTWSKLFELGDTFFIVLRKKPLTFLHWYHHITVLTFCWAAYPQYEPIIRWFGVVNMFVHSLMYFYYFLKALHIHIPRFISMCITTVQMSQMLIGIGLNIYAIYIKGKGQPCARSEEGITLHLTMYGSYLVLFANYFYRSYIAHKPLKKKKKA